MLKSEFEELAGYSVSTEDYYDILEPMYMATDLDKKSFVDAVSRKRFEKKKEKSSETLILERKIKGEIASLEREIQWNKKRIEFFEKSFSETKDVSLKNTLKGYKDEIILYRNKIKALKWILQ